MMELGERRLKKKYFSEAIRAFQEAANKLATNDQESAEALYKLGSTCRIVGKLHEAEQSLVWAKAHVTAIGIDEQLDFKEQVNKDKAMSTLLMLILRDLGVTRTEIGNFLLAKQNLEQSYNISVTEGQAEESAYTYGCIGWLKFQETGDIIESMLFLSEANKSLMARDGYETHKRDNLIKIIQVLDKKPLNYTFLALKLSAITKSRHKFFEVLTIAIFSKRIHKKIKSNIKLKLQAPT